MIKKCSSIVLLVACLYLPVLAKGQVRQERKMQQLYHQKNYIGCSDYARKLISKKASQQWASPYFYEALSLQHLFVSAEGKVDKEIIRASLWATKKGKQYDLEQEYFTPNHIYYDSLLFYYHHLIRNFMYSYHKTEAKAMVSLLASVLGDTTEWYKVFFLEKSQPDVLTTNVKKPYYPSAPLLTLADSVAAQACGYQSRPENKQTVRFIHEVHASKGFFLPEDWEEVIARGEKTTLATLQKGDLIFWGKDNIKHVAMYISDPGEMPRIVHCPYGSVVVDVFTSDSWWRKQRIHSVIRICEGYREEAGALAR
jgi:hypothetical protein